MSNGLYSWFPPKKAFWLALVLHGLSCQGLFQYILFLFIYFPVRYNDTNSLTVGVPSLFARTPPENTLLVHPDSSTGRSITSAIFLLITVLLWIYLLFFLLLFFFWKKDLSSCIWVYLSFSRRWVTFFYLCSGSILRSVHKRWKSCSEF